MAARRGILREAEKRILTIESVDQLCNCGLIATFFIKKPLEDASLLRCQGYKAEYRDADFDIRNLVGATSWAQQKLYSVF